MKISLIFILIAGLILFSGCGTKKSSSEQETETAVESPGFSWDSQAGEVIEVEFNQHPYSAAVIKQLKKFENLTGISVHYSFTPEENYFDRINYMLESESGDPDVFMTGAYQIWDYSARSLLADFDDFLEDRRITSEDYNVQDFFPNIIGAFRWDTVTGHRPGSGPLWAIPMGFEQYVLAYNKRIFTEMGLSPPTTMEQLLELCYSLDEFGGPGTYAIALRGTCNWATTHPGFMTTYANYGAVDFEISDGRLISAVDSAQAVEMISKWIEIIRAGASPQWPSYTWYHASRDFGAGKAAMLFDADIVSYFQNVEGGSREAGNIAWVKAPMPESAQGRALQSNLWVWGLAINSRSESKNAAWMFVQYFTGREFQLDAAVSAKSVNPPRQSVFYDPAFIEMISESESYLEAFNVTIEGTSILFTPEPYFFEFATEWAELLRRLVEDDTLSVEDELLTFKEKIDLMF